MHIKHKLEWKLSITLHRFFKVGGQTLPNHFDKQKKKAASQNHVNPNPGVGDGGEGGGWESDHTYNFI